MGNRIASMILLVIAFIFWFFNRPEDAQVAILAGILAELWYSTSTPRRVV